MLSFYSFGLVVWNVVKNVMKANISCSSLISIWFATNPTSRLDFKHKSMMWSSHWVLHNFLWDEFSFRLKMTKCWDGSVGSLLYKRDAFWSPGFKIISSDINPILIYIYLVFPFLGITNLIISNATLKLIVVISSDTAWEKQLRNEYLVQTF